MGSVRVAHLFPELVLGGADRAVLDLVRHLPDRGYACDLYVLRDHGRFPQPDLVPGSLVDLGHPGPVTRPWKTLVTARRLRRHLRASKTDLLHTHLWPADVVGAAANGPLGLPHVSHQQGTGPELLRTAVKPRIKRASTRWLLRRSGTVFVAVSEDVRRHTARLYGVPAESVHLAYNAFDPEQFPEVQRTGPVAPGALTIGTAGRFAQEKGLEHAIRAVAAARAEGTDARLRLAGDGPLRGTCADLVASLDLAEVVDLPGSVSNMAAFYRSVDVFCLPSLHSEGFSLSLVEAMAMGCVPVASDVPGVREAIEDGVDGIVVQSGDERGLAAVIERLAGDPALLASMSGAACTKARTRFATGRLVDDVVRVYEAVLGRQPAQGEGAS